ncbi:MAG TPA: hypothetical protein PKD54_04595, partial [Pirellulaceae bacterium]|nr:hypothetical protein [Pirellulaceae bacterium]
LGKVVLWDIASGERVAEIGDELDTILSADISADHSLVALGGPQKVVRVFRVATGELLYERRKHTDWVTGVSFSPDGVLLASADRSGNVFVWEAHTGNEYLTLRGHSQMVKEIAWRWDSNLLATVSDDATIRWWELENGGQVKSLTAHAGGASWAVFNREGLMLSGGRDRLVKLWNANGDQQAQFTSASDLVACCAYCSETNRVVASDWLGNVWVWNGNDGTPLGQLSPNPPSLSRRLADAQQASNDAQSVLVRAEGTFQESEQQFQRARESLSHGMEALSVRQTAVDHIEQALAAKQAVVQTKLAEQQAWQSELADKQRLAPDLEILAAKAREVADISADDPELKDAAQKLTDKLATTAARIDELTRLTSEAQSAQTELVGQIQQLGQQRDQERAELEKQQVVVAELQSELNQREATLMAHKSELDSAKQVADQAADAVMYWQEEIAFVSKLELLHLELTEAERQIQEDVARRDVIAEELRQVQARLAEAEQAIRASTETANGIQQSLQTLQQPK